MTTSYRHTTIGQTGRKLSQIVADADSIAKNTALSMIEITERLSDLGFSGISFRRDHVVASINGVTFRLGA